MHAPTIVVATPLVDGLHGRHAHAWPHLPHAERPRSARRARRASPPARRRQWPELTSRTLDAWAYRRGVQLQFISPGKPVDNAFVESFNGRFREECLNEHWFLDLKEARETIEAGAAH
jgi:transposase InsO family protein